MLPTFHLGPLQVGTYGLLALVGLLVTGLYVIHRLLWLDLPRRVILVGFVLVILGGLTGTVLMSWLITSIRVTQSGLLARPEGYSVVWALSAGALVLVVYAWRVGAPVGRVLDLVALPIPLGLAVGRLGCAAAGCCYGRPTDSWLGVYLPDQVGMWAVRYPTQLMSAVVDLFIFVTLLAVERYGMRRVGRTRTWPFNGFLLLLALILFASKRFVMGFLRESGPGLVGSLSWMHLSALVVLVASAGLMVWGLVRTGRDADS